MLLINQVVVCIITECVLFGSPRVAEPPWCADAQKKQPPQICSHKKRQAQRHRMQPSLPHTTTTKRNQAGRKEENNEMQ